MRLHILSDLHLEFGEMEIPKVDADVVILAGDIHVGEKGIDWAYYQFPQIPVIYVAGNHEFYHQAFPELIERLLRRAGGSNIHLLENEAVEINGYRFLGCTLWTDFDSNLTRSVSMEEAEGLINDFRVVRNRKTGKALKAWDTVEFHEKSVRWLKKELKKGDPSKTIVVTHHAPSLKSEEPCYAGGNLSPAFVSDLDYLIKSSKVPLWIHGHTHYNVDYKIGKTRVLSNQFGYPQQPCKGFNPGLVVEV